MSTIQKVSQHVLAVLASVAFFALVPLVVYGSLVIPRAVSAADLGGPLNFVIIPLGGALLGLAISVVAFLPLSLLAERFGFRRWWHTLAFIAFLLAAIVVVAAVFLSYAGGQETNWLPALVCSSLALYLVGGFLIYLCCVGVFYRLSQTNLTGTKKGNHEG
jgi:hypothetical protein